MHVHHVEVCYSKQHVGDIVVALCYHRLPASVSSGGLGSCTPAGYLDCCFVTLHFTNRLELLNHVTFLQSEHKIRLSK